MIEIEYEKQLGVLRIATAFSLYAENAVTLQWV